MKSALSHERKVTMNKNIKIPITIGKRIKYANSTSVNDISPTDKNSNESSQQIFRGAAMLFQFDLL